MLVSLAALLTTVQFKPLLWARIGFKESSLGDSSSASLGEEHMLRIIPVFLALLSLPLSLTGCANPTFPVAVFFGGPGSGKVATPNGEINCTATCSAQFPNGTTITVTATPEQGSKFAGWGGSDCTGGNPTCVVTLTKSTRLIGYFRSEFKMVAAGANHTCALRPTGNVVCWGLNTSGQLGFGATSNWMSPGAVPGITNAVAIAAGGYHTCALIVGGTVRCWGNNREGALGDETNTDRASPTVVPGPTEIVAITAGAYHTCMVRAGGTLSCTGLNSHGQLGDGTTTNRNVTATSAALGALGPLTNKIAAGGLHTCAIVAADSTVACWGNNFAGQLGLGNASTRVNPGPKVQQDQGCTPAPGQGCANAIVFLKAKEIAASIGVGTPPTRIPGGFHSLALDSNNKDWGWGDNSETQIFPILQSGGPFSSDRPQAIQGINFKAGGPPLYVSKIAAGAFHSCMLSILEGVFCRGSNGFGESGPTPNAASVPSTLGAVDIAAGGYHTCAVVSPMFGFSTDPAGSVACWGENGDGQVNGTPGGSVTTPAFLTLP
jgi:alpha-tubulin suppressor-like RCC1 family protein